MKLLREENFPKINEKAIQGLLILGIFFLNVQKIEIFIQISWNFEVDKITLSEVKRNCFPRILRKTIHSSKIFTKTFPSSSLSPTNIYFSSLFFSFSLHHSMDSLIPFSKTGRNRRKKACKNKIPCSKRVKKKLNDFTALLPPRNQCCYLRCRAKK